jgi:hypothetical protein
MKFITHLHLSSNALDVFTGRTSGTPASVLLNSISTSPAHAFQPGVIVGVDLILGVSDIEKSRKDCANALTKAVLS